jgi:hypothetical protein
VLALSDQPIPLTAGEASAVCQLSAEATAEADFQFTILPSE